MIRYTLGLIFALLAVGNSAAALDQTEFNKLMGTYLQDEANLKTVSDALQKHFASQRQQQQMAAQKKAEADMEKQFESPVIVPTEGSPFKGPKDAKVTVVEYSDFECPYCSRGKDTMEQVLKAYPKDVKVVFKHLPLGFHRNAMPAARASMAAHEQGKFWEMHDALFTNQKGLGDDFYFATAKEIGLDIDKFKKDYASGKYDKQIKADAAFANSNGISGTPGFFVNGVKVTGARPFPDFKKIIDRWLAKGKTAAAKPSANVKTEG